MILAVILTALAQSPGFLPKGSEATIGETAAIGCPYRSLVVYVLELQAAQDEALAAAVDFAFSAGGCVSLQPGEDVFIAENYRSLGGRHPLYQVIRFNDRKRYYVPGDRVEARD